MKTESIVLISARDALPLETLVAYPDNTARGVVQISHGMCEHKERYIPFLEFLTENDYAVILHDHRGHGAAALARGDLGYFGKDGANALVDDLHQVTLEAKKRLPGIPVYLFGHSMGSLAARAYLLKYEKELSGAFVCGSPAYNPGVHFGIGLARLLSACKGEKSRGKLLKILAFGPYYRAFPQSKCSWICSDPEVVRAYEASRLCNFTFTNNGFLALFELMKLAYRTSPPTSCPDLPIHFLSGAQDSCMGGEKGFEKAVGCMLRRGYTRVSGRVYENMRHEILNERGKAQVFSDVLAILRNWEAER